MAANDWRWECVSYGEVAAFAVAGGIIGGVIGATGGVAIAEGANFAQNWYRPNFSDAGSFKGTSVGQLASRLRSGTVKPSEVPTEVITRDGQQLILNTRSAKALEQAGIPRTRWYGRDMTGNAAAETRLDNQLSRNNLDSNGVLNPTLVE